MCSERFCNRHVCQPYQKQGKVVLPQALRTSPSMDPHVGPPRPPSKLVLAAERQVACGMVHG